MMRRLLLHATVLLSLLCACSGADRILDRVEETMIVKPEDAFTALAEMDTLSMSEGQKSRRALLQAYLATVYVEPMDMPPADLCRAISAFDGKCTPDEVKSLIIKSEFAKASGNPVVRLELLKDAEFLASQLDDSTDLAFIYLYLSKTYANGFNGTVSEYYANRSLQLFNASGYRKQSIDARMAIVGALASKRDYTTMLDTLISMKADVFAYSTDSYRVYYLDQLARTLDENDRSREAIDIWHAIYDIDSISSNTLAHWARAYIHVDRLDSAGILINKAIASPHNCSDEYLCRNVQYDIWQRLGRTTELSAIDSLRESAANIDYEGRKIAESSLALNMKYDSATRSAWNEIQANRVRTLILTFGSVIIILLLSGVILLIRKRNRLLKVENDNNILRLQNLEHNLFESQRRHDVVAEKISTLFRAPFKTIDQLASAYSECKETSLEQKRIIAEAKMAIERFRSEESLAQMEEIVNATNGNLMKHFDEDFPRISTSQRRLALFLFCGLSLQSISIFQDTELRNIYVYKSRLKSIIARSDSAYKDIYLSYF